MMEFRVVEKAMVNLLGDNARGEFRVIGYEQFPQGATSFLGKNRVVRIFYSGGDFTLQAGSIHNHEFEMTAEMCVTADAEGDLDTLLNASATQEQLALAMSSMRPSADVANDAANELIDLVFNIIGNPENLWLGLEPYRVKGVRILKVRKDRLIPYGEHAVITATLVTGITVVENANGGRVPTKRTADTLTIEGNG